MCGLILSGNTLYGTANAGGVSDGGTVFAVNTDGTEFTNLHSFNGSTDGARPVSELLLVGNTLYGTASGLGAGVGTVFSLSLPVSPPRLSVVCSAANVIVSWPTNSAGFVLQSSTNVGSGIWTADLPAPVFIKDQNVVTNPISGTQQFFRLSQ